MWSGFRLASTSGWNILMLRIVVSMLRISESLFTECNKDQDCRPALMTRHMGFNVFLPSELSVIPYSHQLTPMTRSTIQYAYIFPAYGSSMSVFTEEYAFLTRNRYSKQVHRRVRGDPVTVHPDWFECKIRMVNWLLLDCVHCSWCHDTMRGR
jgi:hypothetical protein